MHMDADTAVSILHLEASAGEGEIFPPCPWVCPLSPCTSRAGCPGLQRENMGVNLGGIAGCLAQSLSIRIPSEASVCVCSLLGHLGAGQGSEGESLCVVVTSSLDHTSWEVPSSLMLLKVLGGVSAHQQQHYTLAMSRLAACPGFCFCWCHQQPKRGCCLGVGAAAPEKGGTNRLGQMVRQVVFIPAGQSPGSASLLMCDIPSVTP